MDEYLEDGIVFRLANTTNDFPPHSEKLQPAHLTITERDRAAATKSKSHPTCSVFDRDRCSVAQAKVIRGRDREATAFGFRVADIIIIWVEGLPGLQALRVPLDPPDSELAGADGHCGIAGLNRPEGMPNGKNLFYALRAKLADRSFRLADQD